MNIVELLAVVRKCFERNNPKVLIPKKFSKQKMEVLNRARKEVKVNRSGATLINLVRMWVRMLSDKDNKAYDKCMKALAKLDTLPPALIRRLEKKQGEGQLRFTVESPAGPSRLCRVPFYPIRTENAWSSRFIDIDSNTPSRQSFGIEELGDDPVINIGPWFGSDGVVVYQNSIKMPTIQLMTQKVEFGAYRLVGMEINAYFGSRYIGAINPGAAAVGAIEVVGTPAAATGTVIAVGPEAVEATGRLRIIGLGTEATGSVEFIGAPAAATGDITVNGNGDQASVLVTIPGGDAAAGATIDITGTASAGDGVLAFFQGDQATATIRPNVVSLTDGDQILLSSGGGTTGLPAVSELYTARTTPAAANDFQAGILSVSLPAFETLINGLGVGTTYSAVYGVGGGANVEMTTKGRGTGYNRARNLGGNIISIFGFTVGIPAQLEFSGGTDAVPAGTTVQVTDLTGATNTCTAVLSGSGAGANQFETYGSDDTTRDNVITAFTALAIGSLNITPPSKGTVRFTYTTTGFLPPASGVIGDPFIACSDPSPTITQITAGLDVLDYGSVFTIEEFGGTSVSFGAQPLGTTVPGGFTAFITTNDINTTAANLRAVVNASALTPDLTVGGAANSMSLTETQFGRAGNNPGSPAYTTPYGVGVRPLVDVGTIVVFSAGDSPVANGTILTLTDTTGATYNITGTDGGAVTASTFDTSLSVLETRDSVINAIDLNVGVFDALGFAANTFQIEQEIRGIVGNSRAVSSNAVGQFTFSNPTFTGGVDAVTAGDTIAITSTSGTTETYTFVTSGAGGFNILSTGLAVDQATNIANAINASVNFSAVVNGGVPEQIDITQATAGPLGNTIITVSPADLLKTNFSGGVGVYPTGQNISITDVDGVTELFVALAAGPETATNFVVDLSASNTASSLATAIGLRGLNITTNVVGDVLNLTQGEAGTAGNVAITPSSAPNATVTGFVGGTNLVTAGTTISVEDNTGATQVFTGVAAAAGANQFDVRGDSGTIATSISNSVNARFAAGPTLTSAPAIGGVIDFTQGSVGTINNGRTLSSSDVAEINESVSPFSGGVDNVSTGTTITLTDEAGVTQVFSSLIGGVPGPTQFSVDNIDPTNTISNLALTVNGFAIDITGVAVGNTVTFTQGTNGPDGNTAILSSDATELAKTDFTGGTFSVELGSVITITSTDGTIAAFTAVDGATTATTYDVQPATVDTLNNLSTAIGLSAINGKVTPVVGAAVISLSQVLSGTGGNVPITIAGDAIPATLTATGFAGGTNNDLNLTNPLSPIAITIKELTVYNGNNILIVEDSESVSATEFNILNRSEQIEFSQYVFDGAGVPVQGQTSQPLSDENHDDGYKFIGFRDQPIVDSNSQVFVKVDAFIANLPTWDVLAGDYPANTPRPKIPPVSFSVNLVVDLLDDKVFGDSFAPSPASRAAANVKLSGREVDGNRIILSNSVAKKPQI